MLSMQDFTSNLCAVVAYKVQTGGLSLQGLLASQVQLPVTLLALAFACQVAAARWRLRANLSRCEGHQPLKGKVGTVADGHLQAGSADQGLASTLSVACTPGWAPPAAMLTGGSVVKTHHLEVRAAGNQQAIACHRCADACTRGWSPEVHRASLHGSDQRVSRRPCASPATAAGHTLVCTCQQLDSVREGSWQTMLAPAQRFQCCQHLGSRCPGQPVTGCYHSVPVTCPEGRRNPRHLQQQKLPGCI